MRKAFTLIELLIVVAIIAILAAIAVPNFLEAQTRSKVSRVKADMRSCAVAVEAYAVDWNVYAYDGYNNANITNPDWPAGSFNYWFLCKWLTTPQAYLTDVKFVDPFRQHLSSPTHWQYGCLRHIVHEATWGTKYDTLVNATVAKSTYYRHTLAEWGAWRLQAAGPDRTYGPGGWPGVSTTFSPPYPIGALPQPYDPTNGTASQGDVIRSQTGPDKGYSNTG
jgi:prepilin-type N-terminal cleavage/methylation domain-containing protein